jgi:hypothetical protein
LDGTSGGTVGNQRKICGAAFVGIDGRPLDSGILETYTLEILVGIQSTLQLIYLKKMGISRSLRQGATTHAQNMGVNKQDIDAMNNWRNSK